MKNRILTLLLSTLTLASYSSAAMLVSHPGHDHGQDNPDTGQMSSAEEAATLLKKVHENYKNADAIIETLKLTMPAMMPGEEADTMEIKTAIDSSSGKVYAEDQMTAIWTDGNIYITLEGMDESYIEQKAGTMSAGLSKATGGQGLPGLWTVALRESDDLNEWVSSFALGMPGAALTGVEESSNGNVILMNTMMGSVAITVTPELTVSNVVLTIIQPGMPEMELKAEAVTEIVKEIPAVMFDSGDRKKYDSIEAIIAESNTPSVGAPGEEEAELSGETAPDFTLASLDGTSEVTLSKLKGTVVVLDFWATWCGPCKRGLPMLNEFDTWAKEEGLNVKVYAVNVWERGDAAAVKEKVSKFWIDNKYSAPVLMGSSDDKLTDNYGVSGIPTTVIIGLDGRVSTTHVGFSADMVDVLKKDVAAALASK